jgi:hypothetical protein
MGETWFPPCDSSDTSPGRPRVALLERAKNQRFVTAAAVFLLFLDGEELDGGQHRDGEHDRREHEQTEPAARVIGPPAREEEGRSERERDEDESGARQSDLVRRRQPEQHGRDYKGTLSYGRMLRNTDRDGFGLRPCV